MNNNVTSSQGKQVDSNGLTYIQTPTGRVYDSIKPNTLICGGFHTYNKKQIK